MTVTSTSQRADERRQKTDGFDRRLLVPMVLGSVLNPVNSSIISVSLVAIGVAFGAPPSQTVWLVSALYVATAIGQPMMGRLIELYGPRPLFLTGAALTGLAGLVGVLAPSLWVLVLARVILGFGTCAGYPASMYLLRSEADRTGRSSPAGVLSVLAIANQTVIVIGPALGGLLIHLGGWRTTFAINIPLALGCLIVGMIWLPKTTAPRETRSGLAGLAGLDLPGMVLFAAMLVSLLLFLMNPQAGHWYLLVITAVLAAAFGVRELRTAQPFLDIRTLAGNRPLLASYARGLLIAMVANCFLYGFPQWLEEDRGLDPTTAGLVMLPMSATAIAVSAIAGRRAEIRGKLLAGSAAQLAACALLLAIRPSAPLWLLPAAACAIGIPYGLNNLAIQNAVYHQADPQRIGSSAGLLRTFSYLGAIGSTVGTSAFLTPGSGTTGLHHLAWFMLAASALFLLITVADRTLRHTATTTA
ncbi:MFS transporter [Streptomyces triculaminicus]|uniref:MFS transporter n=1 Tax=Streptomyces triculaminicus TaxID=2816232 RepID=UPI0034113CE4